MITFIAGGFHIAVSIGLVVLALVQAVTMLALAGLTPWAWYATVLLFTVSGAVNLYQDNFVGMVISFVIVAYVGVHRGLFGTA